MKKLIFATFLSLLSLGLFAQENPDTTYWTKKGIAGLNLNQVSMSNWSAGGESSVGMDLLLNYSMDYKKEKLLWQNRLELAYGLNYTDGDGTKKTHDNIYLSSNYGYNIGRAWYLGVLLTYQTQFAKGYDYKAKPKNLLSKFMSPGYLSIGPGVTWTPKKWFTATFSPATWRGTFVLDNDLSDQGAFGVDKGKHLLNQFGGNINAEINYEFLPNMTLISRLNLFSDYLDKPQNVAVRWDVLVNMKINKWFAANFIINTIYDDKIKIADKNGNKKARFQIKESLGIGLQASF